MGFPDSLDQYHAKKKAARLERSRKAKLRAAQKRDEKELDRLLAEFKKLK